MLSNFFNYSRPCQVFALCDLAQSFPKILFERYTCFMSIDYNCPLKNARIQHVQTTVTRHPAAIWVNTSMDNVIVITKIAVC